MGSVMRVAGDDGGCDEVDAVDEDDNWEVDEGGVD
jgi:hypothetical protein